MPSLPVINPDIRPRLRRAKGRKRLKFKKRSPFKGYKVNAHRKKRRTVRRRNVGRSLMVVNPRRRSRRRRRMPAGLRRYWASRRRNNPATPAAPAVNPRRRRRRRSYRRYRRNPMGLPRQVARVFRVSTLTDALWGAMGFVGTKSVPAMLPIPVQFKIGPMRYVTGAVSAWGLGMLTTQFAGRRIGNLIWLGGSIAVAADILSDVLLPMLPTFVSPAITNAGGTAGYLGNGSPRELGLGARLPYGIEETAWGGV